MFDFKPFKFFIYGFYEEGVRLPFYIGKSNDKFGEQHRLTKHKLDAKKGNTNYWVQNKINKLDKLGIAWKQRVIKYFEVKEESQITEIEALVFDLEIELIFLIGRRQLGTGPLCNMTDGGDGPLGRVTPHYIYDAKINPNELIKEYCFNKLTISQVALKLGVSGFYVKTKLNHLGIRIRRAIESEDTPIVNTYIEAIWDLFENQRICLSKIIEMYQFRITKNALTAKFKAFGLKTIPKTLITKEAFEEMREMKFLYENGMTSYIIAERFNLSVPTVLKRLKECDTRNTHLRRTLGSVS